MSMASPLASSPDPVIPSLPDDLALDCLYRVPVGEHSKLLRVCSSWKALVSGPSFSESRRHLGYTDDYACFVQASLQPPPPAAVHGDDDPGTLSLKSAKQPVAYGISLYYGSTGWSRLPPPPSDFLFGSPNQLGFPLFCQCTSSGRKMVLMGGWDPWTYAVLRTVFVYDLATRVWTRGADMPRTRSFFGLASPSGSESVVVAGGHDADKNALRTADAYDVEADCWRQLPDMAVERDECKAVALPDGKVLVASGYATESQGRFVRSAECYDPSTGKWEVVENWWMGGGRGPGCVVAVEGILYAVVEGKLWRLKQQEVEEGDEDSEGGSGWQEVAGLPKELKEPTCATVLWKSGDILVSGLSWSPPHKASVWRFAPGSGKWGELPGFGGVIQAACSIHV